MDRHKARREITSRGGSGRLASIAKKLRGPRAALIS
jgi:hypothetical protein